MDANRIETREIADTELDAVAGGQALQAVSGVVTGTVNQTVGRLDQATGALTQAAGLNLPRVDAHLDASM